MGEEERRLILQMVAEGKITPEEGVRLLEALGGVTGRAGRAPGGESAERVAGPEPGERGAGGESAERAAGPEPGERGAGAAGAPTAETGRAAGELGEMGSRVADGVMRVLEMFPWAGAEFRDHLCREGQFAGEGPWEVTVELANGRLTVEGWDGPGWRLELDVQVRGREARKAADLVTVEADGRSLRVRSARSFGWNYSASGVLKLPPGEYQLRGVTSNGRIGARGLRCAVLGLETSNGRIEVDGIEGERVELNTSNGSIVARISARRLEATTSNGTIRVVAREIRQDSYELRTSNGSIKLICPDLEAGYRVDAVASLGSIVVDLPGMPRQVARGAAARAQLQVATPAFEGRERRLDARLRTSCGPIAVSMREE